MWIQAVWTLPVENWIAAVGYEEVLKYITIGLNTMTLLAKACLALYVESHQSDVFSIAHTDSVKLPICIIYRM